MKKVIKYLLLFFVSLACLVSNVTNTYAATVNLTGPSTVRGGDTITLNLRVNDDGKYGLEGVLEYDSSQVTLSGIETGLTGWAVESNGNNIIAYDDSLSNGLSGTSTVVVLKFKVANGIATGTKIDIAVNDIVTTDGTSENSFGKAIYSVTVAKPLSSNANLATLSVSGATLSPAFSAGTTSYDLGEVDYSVSKLSLSYTTEDATATVSVKGNSLSVGKNTISITVTAEDGTAKVYKLTVTRKQDPNYVASSNANLKSMSVNLGMISPTFSTDVTNYVVYLPYECAGSSFTATGAAADSKASGVADGTIDKLVEGNNQTVVVCKAEDGTEKAYAITVVVMPEYTGEVPSIGGTDTPVNPPTDVPEDTSTEDNSGVGSKDTEASSGTENDSQNTSEDDTTTGGDDDGNGNALVTILVILVVVVLIGALVYVLFFTNKRF